jgi:ABC-2 type transport system ATP-binding protein
MLEFYKVRKTFDADPILIIAEQRVDNGIHWLQGANGTGKTTLLRMIAGIVPFEGDILACGQSQRKDPVGYRRLVGWADAEPLYPGFLTGDDLLRFYSGILRPEAGQQEELIQRFGVRSWLKTRVAAWSSGMTKKLSLLLAFLGRPGWVLLDEPLITLDDIGTTALIDLIGDLRRNYGTSFLLSSHQPLPAGMLVETQQIWLQNKSINLIV